MKMGFSKWLNRPFPYDNSTLSNIIIAALFGLFVFLFLFLFQPFSVDSAHNTWQASLGYGLVTFIIMIFNSLVLPRVFSNWFDSDNWKVKNTLVLGMWNIATIAILISESALS